MKHFSNNESMHILTEYNKAIFKNFLGYDLTHADEDDKHRVV